MCLPVASTLTVADLIARRQTGRAIKMFWRLQEKGELYKLQHHTRHMTSLCQSCDQSCDFAPGDSVSMDTQNGLLELLAYHGLGNLKKDGKSEVFLEVSAMTEEDPVDSEIGEEGKEMGGELEMEGSAAEEQEQEEGEGIVKQMEGGEMLEEVVLEGEMTATGTGTTEGGVVREVGEGGKETIHFAEEDLWVDLEGAKQGTFNRGGGGGGRGREEAWQMLYLSFSGQSREGAGRQGQGPPHALQRTLVSMHRPGHVWGAVGVTSTAPPSLSHRVMLEDCGGT